MLVRVPFNANRPWQSESGRAACLGELAIARRYGKPAQALHRQAARGTERRDLACRQPGAFAPVAGAALASRSGSELPKHLRANGRTHLACSVPLSS